MKKRNINFRIRAGAKFLYTGDLNELKSLSIDLKQENNITWQQCSEIPDKKGVMIYEGDILKYTIGTVNFTYLVRFGIYKYPSISDKNSGNGFYIQIVDNKNFYPAPLHDGMTKAFEVIGNVFDNPEIAPLEEIVLDYVG